MVFIPFQFISLKGQDNPSEVFNSWKTLMARQLSNTLIYKDIAGSPYYKNEFINGTVYLIDGKSASVPLRYDIFQDEMEFRKGDSILWVPKDKVKFIRYGSDMLFAGMTYEDTTRLGYFFITDAGNYTLYIKKRVEFYPELPAKAYADKVPERFEREKDVFFLKIKGKPAQRIKNKKTLLAILDDNQDAKTYIRKEKIKTDKAEDLHKLVTFLNNQ